MKRFFVGLDLGQRQDYTALAVVEKSEARTGFDYVRYAPVVEKRHEVRFLERMPLGTPYTRVASRVGEVIEGLGGLGPGSYGAIRWHNGSKCTLVVDATGVGAPVVDMLRVARFGCELVPVTITGADRASRVPGGWRAPKRDLVAALQLMLEQGELRIASGVPLGATLANELMGMRVRVSGAAHEAFGTWRDGSHDDLVLAVALACWRARFPDAGHVGKSLGLGVKGSAA